MFFAFLDLTLLPTVPRTIPLPGEAVAKAISQITLWLAPLALVVAGVLAAAALVWCFLGYRVRRVRHAFGMALLGAAVALIAALLVEPNLSPMWALVIGAGAALVFGAVGAIFWRVGAAVSYFVTAFALVFVGLGIFVPTLEVIWCAVIAGLVGAGAMLLLIFVMPDAEIVVSSLSGFVAAASGARLLSGLFPAWFDASNETAVVLTVLGVGAVLTAAGIVVQYLTTRKIRPLRRSQNKQLADAKEAIRAAAAITFDEGIEPQPKDAAEAAEAAETATIETAETAETTEAAETETIETVEPVGLPDLPEASAESAPKAEEETSVAESEAEEETVAIPPVTEPETAPNGDVKCPACGDWNEPDSRFCSWCGTKL